MFLCTRVIYGQLTFFQLNLCLYIIPMSNRGRWIETTGRIPAPRKLSGSQLCDQRRVQYLLFLSDTAARTWPACSTANFLGNSDNSITTRRSQTYFGSVIVNRMTSHTDRLLKVSMCMSTLSLVMEYLTLLYRLSQPCYEPMERLLPRPSWSYRDIHLASSRPA